MKTLKKSKAKELANALFDFTWSSPLETYLDVETVQALLDEATNPHALNEDFVNYCRERLLRHEENSTLWSLRGTDFVHPSTQTAIENILERNRPPNDELVEELLKVELVSLVLRRLVERVLEAFVDGFLNRDSSALSGVGRSAFGFAARASKGIFEKVSSQVEGPLRQTMQTFVQGSMDRLSAQLGDILKSEEIQNKLGEARVTLFKFGIAQPLSTWSSMRLNEEETSEILSTIPDTISQVAAHETLREIMESEVNHLLNTYGSQPIKALVPDDIRTAVEPHLRAKLQSRWTEFFSSKTFISILEPKA